ncbi:MAG: hypothetical protein ACLQRH_13110 [Acidimicrobiales bacterium]
MCPCGSGRRFQEVLSEKRTVRRRTEELLPAGLSKLPEVLARAAQGIDGIEVCPALRRKRRSRSPCRGAFWTPSGECCSSHAERRFRVLWSR